MLLCNPFGEEAARAHRIYRVLATQLERAGFAALRFDYSGTGDSAGDGADATVDGWLDDVVAAADDLRARSGVRKLVGFGLGLGGTLAVLASQRRGLRFRQLVLWDPVVDGAGYLRELLAMHRAYLDAEFAGVGWHGRVEVTPEGFPREALGTDLPSALASGIGAIDLTAGDLPRAEHVAVITTRTSAPLARLAECWGVDPSCRFLALAASAAWNSDAAVNAQTVPMDVLQAVLSRIEESNP